MLICEFLEEVFALLDRLLFVSFLPLEQLGEEGLCLLFIKLNLCQVVVASSKPEHGLCGNGFAP